MMKTKVWERHLGKVVVTLFALPEHELDLSWDATGEVRKGIESGKYIVFCAKVVVAYGPLSAETYLGECIYENVKDFVRPTRNEYFRDMVREAISELRAAYARAKEIANTLRQTALEDSHVSCTTTPVRP
jgi:hypothetical protein